MVHHTGTTEKPEHEVKRKMIEKGVVAPGNVNFMGGFVMNQQPWIKGTGHDFLLVRKTH